MDIATCDAQLGKYVRPHGHPTSVQLCQFVYIMYVSNIMKTGYLVPYRMHLQYPAGCNLLLIFEYCFLNKPWRLLALNIFF